MTNKKNICLVPEAEAEDSINLIAESGGELRRISVEGLLALAKEKNRPEIEYMTKEW